MKPMKLISIILLLAPVLNKAQTTVEKADKQEFANHEIGLSWGAFPTLGVWYGVAFWMDGDINRYPYWHWETRHPLFSHNHRDENGFYTMQHYGALAFNYQYHFSKRHSMGFNTTWLGRHISNHAERRRPLVFDQLINAKGWEHTFALCANYRFTYYNRNAISLYTAIHLGLAVKLIARKLLFDSEKSSYWAPVSQIIGFGIESGKTHVLVAELGIGAQGLVKIGYRYKFDNK
jgi:hypothetical protein